MDALTEMREGRQTASRERESERWLAFSEPLAIDDDPHWKDSLEELWHCEPAA
jgi:hypothetical protein